VSALPGARQDAVPLSKSPLWWAELPETPVVEPRPLPARADVAVIGAGYTGLSAARSLARGGASVVVLEKHTLGFGASSRNGGQVLTGLKTGAEALLARFGRERSRALFQASLAAIDYLEALVAAERIECGFTRCGHLDAACKPSHLKRFARERTVLEREFGHRVRLLERGEQRSELGSDYYHGLLLDERSASLQPARYLRGLAQAAARSGAELHEGSAVLRVERQAGGYRVVTARGTLAARDVLVATNGYTDGALPALRRRVVPVGSFIIATRPLSPAQASAILPRRRVVFDSRRFLHYFRLSSDERLVFGGRAQFTPASAGSTRRSAEILRRGLAQVFPELAGVDIEYAWSGNVCFTPDLLPRAGCLGGLHYALGYAGHGVAMATFLGDVMADVMLGRPDRNPFQGLPFRPIPFYRGEPWFLPLAGLVYKVLDWLD
jgi:glycine/D-amino acid oxidase-like deaminating enzyme